MVCRAPCLLAAPFYTLSRGGSAACIRRAASPGSSLAAHTCVAVMPLYLFLQPPAPSFLPVALHSLYGIEAYFRH